MNLCSNCQNRHITMGDGAQTLANLCQAPEVSFDPATNPVTGDPCYTGRTDDGEIFYADQPHPLCIYINPHGQCPYYTEKITPEKTILVQGTGWWLDAVGN